MSFLHLLFKHRFIKASALGLGLVAGGVGITPLAKAVSAPQTVVRYFVYAHGLHVMTINGAYRLTGDQYSVAAQSKTGGLFQLFMKTNINLRAQGHFYDSGMPEPESYDSAGWSRGKNRHLSIVYKQDTPDVQAMEPVESDREQILPDERKGAVDNVAILMALLHKVREGQGCGEGEVKVFDGVRLSTLQVQTEGIQPLPNGASKDWGEDGLRCNFVAQQVKGFKLSSADRKARKPQQGRVWFENIPQFGMIATRIEVDSPKMGHIMVELEGKPQQQP
ncbi:hypothetical protein CSR02_07860 [Acetobacter pomorum]|uniref:DUF3108 domain-containing protein n=1 Tax=Acetobacter pomorum TaxID=65959 RepID=A0A2G4RC43_9PROT|nr:DUF3108 domain-containing protein [Acetobacter pomorum]PHY94077.1 hypothetical protein CSR02_07860 [Acetobacter pomorum]